MEEQFYFFVTNLENEDLLKSEVELFYKQLRLSYSRPCFLTFKGPKQLETELLSRQWYFARRVGICHKKYNSHDLPIQMENYLKDSFEAVHIFNANTVQFKSTDLPKIPTSFAPVKNGRVLDVMKVRTDEFWIGEHRLINDQHFIVGGEPEFELPEGVESRAYLKWAEAFELVPELYEIKGTVVELGAAPGGGSQFLFEQGLRILAVDPGQMKFKNVVHLNMAVQELKSVHIVEKEKVVGLFSDMNLSPVQSSNETLRVASFLPNLNFVIINLKMTKIELIDSIEKIKRKFKEAGFSKQVLVQLPSHKKETMLISLKSASGIKQSNP